MAPGNLVHTTGLGSTYGSASGTSFATPMVAGAAALLLSRRPQTTVAELRTALLGSADPVPALRGLTVSGGRLDARGALAALESAAPEPEPVAMPVLAPARRAAARRAATRRP